MKPPESTPASDSPADPFAGSDARADLHAAGVLLHSLIAGRAPFTQAGAPW